MTAFPDDIFLRNDAAGRLHREFAADPPIVDYHCHLDPRLLARGEPFEDIVSLWIAEDPYKWRAMRINGIPERVVTGDATAAEKFDAWAATLPRLVGNPLFHWSAMELKTFFDVDETLTPRSAERIRARCDARLREGDFRPLGLLRNANVEAICTSDGWTDDLSSHEALARDAEDLKIRPSLRADQAMSVQSQDFPAFLSKLADTTDSPIADWETFQTAMASRLDAFDAAGCRMVDVGLDSVGYRDADHSQCATLFSRAIAGEALTSRDATALRSAVLFFLAKQCARRGWTLQLHIGAQRETSTRLRGLSGPAGGYACIGSSQPIEPLCRFLDALEREGSLPRVIVFPLNPSDTEMLASLTGAFAEDGVAGKIQLGPAWWYNDHADGIERQLRAVSAYGLLGRFIGMTTDSRSLLSTVRHDYFRRVFCGLLGEWIEAGSLPDDEALLRPLIEDVCYLNAKRLLMDD